MQRMKDVFTTHWNGGFFRSLFLLPLVFSAMLLVQACGGGGGGGGSTTTTAASGSTISAETTTDASGFSSVEDSLANGDVQVQVNDENGSPIGSATVKYSSDGTDYAIFVFREGYLPVLATGSLSDLAGTAVRTDNDPKQFIGITIGAVIITLKILAAAKIAYETYQAAQNITVIGGLNLREGTLVSICGNAEGINDAIGALLDIATFAIGGGIVKSTGEVLTVFGAVNAATAVVSLGLTDYLFRGLDRTKKL